MVAVVVVVKDAKVAEQPIRDVPSWNIETLKDTENFSPSYTNSQGSKSKKEHRTPRGWKGRHA